MRKNKKKSLLFTGLFALCLTFMTPAVFVHAEETATVDDSAANNNAQESSSSQTDVSQTELKGWQTSASGRKSYYKDGRKVTGINKIGKKYYYFNKSGNLQTKTVKSGKFTYYCTKKGILEAYSKGSTYYFADGTKMDKVEKNDYATLQTAKKIAAKITNSKMSKKQKFKACFKWVMDKHYRTKRKFKNTKGWPAVYANDHFKDGYGDCHSDAAAFAYLIKALGYKNVYVCCDSKGEGHSWAEVDGKVYDPLFAQSKSYSKNYGVSYKVYNLTPILHIEITNPAEGSHSSTSTSSSAGKTTSGKTKSGLVKENGVYHYYNKKGVMVKKTWKTINGYKYYFQKDGSAVTGWFKDNTYYFDKKGRMLTGIRVVSGKLYSFGSNGKQDKKTTKKLQKAAKENKSISALSKLLGEPLKKTYYYSCYGDGKDGEWKYKNFKVYTFKPTKGKEIFMGVE